MRFSVVSDNVMAELYTYFPPGLLRLVRPTQLAFSSYSSFRCDTFGRDLAFEITISSFGTSLKCRNP